MFKKPNSHRFLTELLGGDGDWYQDRTEDWDDSLIRLALHCWVRRKSNPLPTRGKILEWVRSSLDAQGSS